MEITLLAIAIVAAVLTTPFALRFSLARAQPPENVLAYVLWVLSASYVLLSLV